MKDELIDEKAERVVKGLPFIFFPFGTGWK